jgi:hypothetical protein
MTPQMGQKLPDRAHQSGGTADLIPGPVHTYFSAVVRDWQ